MYNDYNKIQIKSVPLFHLPLCLSFRCVVPSSLQTAQSPSQCLNAKTMCLSDLLYHQSSRLRDELRVAIARAANQGEDYLIELSNQICMCLQVSALNRFRICI